MLDAYRQGFQPSNIIGKIDKDVKSMIADKLSTAKNVAFVNSTWIENDRQIQSIKGGAQKILDKGRVSKYNKKFSNLRSKK